YELDLVDLRQKSKAALWPAMMSLGQHNMSLVMDNVPPKALLDLGFDLDRWFPLPRRMVQTARFMIGHRRKREHHRRTLDALRERFDVRCGPLPEHNS
ncbi:potassium transporter, partial [Antrihabitans sp. NCIMB 15448]